MSIKATSPKDVSKFVEEQGIQFIDLKFTDLYGQWQHFSVPVDYYDEDDLFKTGLGFDGSSIRGFKSIESSDMLLLCDPTSAFIDPICAHPTLSDIPVIGEIFAFNRLETQQTDIILTLTPHIVRVLDLTDVDVRAFKVGRDTGTTIIDVPTPTPNRPQGNEGAGVQPAAPVLRPAPAASRRASGRPSRATW